MSDIARLREWLLNAADDVQAVTGFALAMLILIPLTLYFAVYDWVRNILTRTQGGR
jgi:hypothetical protein